MSQKLFFSSDYVPELDRLKKSLTKEKEANMAHFNADFEDEQESKTAKKLQRHLAPVDQMLLRNPHNAAAGGSSSALRTMRRAAARSTSCRRADDCCTRGPRAGACFPSPGRMPRAPGFLSSTPPRRVCGMATGC